MLLSSLVPGALDADAARAWLASLAGLLVLASCNARATIYEPVETFEDRSDLSVLRTSSRIEGSVSDAIEFEVPEGTGSVLLEVRGSTGRYYLSKLVTPLGRDLIEAGQFVTRSARELPGIVSWMYPNTPDTEPEPGVYRLIIRAEDSSGGRASDETIEVRVYFKSLQSTSSSCGLRLDFLVADDAIVTSEAERLAAELVTELDTRLAGTGIHILDRTISIIQLPTADLDLGGSPSQVISQIDDVMRWARDYGQIRSQALHVILVRSLGGGIRGYSMGLPGPMGKDLPTSSVLVASRAFANTEGILNVQDMVVTLAHEIGHYLGLYHTSENDRLFHDPIMDTPECTDANCPEVYWQNVMTPGGVNRTLWTTGQTIVMRRHPLCVPTGGTAPQLCNLECVAPQTCSVQQSVATCALACDPAGDPCANSGTCLADDNGKYVCTHQ